jgi:hypothetical protein
MFLFQQDSTKRNIGYQRGSIALAHDMGSTHPVEIYATRRCHMGTGNDYTTIFSPSSLRTMLFLKAGGHVRVLP